MKPVNHINWKKLSHAYGNASDVPGMLERMRSADKDTASEAYQDFYASVFHQDTVYPATAPSIPFLARMAADPEVTIRENILWLLGRMADIYDEKKEDLAAVRRAVTEQAPLLIPLLDDPAGPVRQFAAIPVAYCPDLKMQLLPVLERHILTDNDVLARASLLAALAQQSPEHAAPHCNRIIASGSPVEKAMAAWLIAMHGMDWTERAAQAFVDAWKASDGKDPLSGSGWTDSSLNDLTGKIGLKSVPVLIGLAGIDKALSVAGYAAENLMHIYRAAPGQVIPVLEKTLTKQESALSTIVTLRSCKSLLPWFREPLAEIALTDKPLPSPGATGLQPRNAQVEAILALIDMGDSRWKKPLTGLMDRNIIPNGLWHDIPDANTPYDPGLFLAVRKRMKILAQQETDKPFFPEAIGWIRLMEQWGKDLAAEAIPEITALLPYSRNYGPEIAVSWNLAGTVPVLHQMIARVQKDVIPSVVKAIWQLTGDLAPVRTYLPGLILEDYDRKAIEVWAATDDPELYPYLLPLLNGQAASNYPKRSGQCCAASVYLQSGGDKETVLPTIKAILEGGDKPAAGAADLAAGMGASGMLPLLRKNLNDRFACIAAAAAIFRLTGQADGLSDIAIRTILDGTYLWKDAIGLLSLLNASDKLPELRQMCLQDKRIITSGVVNQIIIQDEQIVNALNQLILKLEGNL